MLHKGVTELMSSLHTMALTVTVLLQFSRSRRRHLQAELLIRFRIIADCSTEYLGRWLPLSCLLDQCELLQASGTAAVSRCWGNPTAAYAPACCVSLTCYLHLEQV
jgi:hypothetical protein